MSRRILGYLDGKPQWSLNEPAHARRQSGRISGLTLGNCVVPGNAVVRSDADVKRQAEWAAK